MKNSRALRIISALLFLAAIIAVASAFAFAAGGEKKLEEATELLNAAKSATDLGEKETKLKKVGAYLDSNPIDGATEGYGAFLTEYGTQVAAVAKPLVEAATALKDGDHLPYSLAAERVCGFLDLHPVGRQGVGSVFAAELQTFDTEYSVARKAQRAKLEASTPISEYDYAAWVDTDFDGAVPSYGQQLKDNVITRETYGGNGVLTIRYLNKAHTYFTYKIQNPKQGFVLELDVTSFGDLPAGMTFENGSVTVNGATKYPHFMNIDAAGNLLDNNKVKVVDGVVRAGQWTHLAVAFDPVDFVYRYYVNDVYVGQADAKIGGYTYTQNTMRVGFNTGSGEMSFDNYRLYSGSSPRTLDKFENASEDDLFIAYANSINIPGMKVGDVVKAYCEAEKLLPGYWDASKEEYVTDNAELRSAVDVLLAFDIDSVVKEYSDSNRDEYIGLMEKVTSVVRTLDNVTERESCQTAADDFYKSYSTYMTMDVIYQSAREAYDKAVEAINADKAALSFIAAMDRYDKATASFHMTSAINTAVQYLDTMDLTVLGVPGFERLDAAYDSYINSDERVAEVIRRENSEAIVGYCRLLSQYLDEASWVANANLVEQYVLRVRSLLKSDYDPDYVGIAASMAVYEPVNSYFYSIDQNAHIAYIEAQLNRYDSAAEFVNKLGAVSAIRVYVSENDVDMSNERIAHLLEIAEAYQGELEVQREDYGAVLKANSASFIIAVTKMTLTDDYEKLRALRDEAYAYYYAVDASVEGCAEAIAIYDRIAADILQSQEAAATFSDRVVALALVEEETVMFRSLSECAYLSTLVKYEVEGYAETLADYEEARDAYMSGRTEANSEIAGVAETAANVRAPFVADGLVAVIKRVFEI